MNNESNIIQLLSFVVLSGIIISFMHVVSIIERIIEFHKTYSIMNICDFDSSCGLLTGLVLSMIVFLLHVYLGYLFKKEKKLFRIYFIGILTINLMVEGSFYLIESINFSQARLFFGLFYILIFSLFLFRSKEGKKIFVN